jgi:peptide/nickel transport system permease protein
VGKYLLRRLVMIIPMLIVVTMLCTGMLSLIPGDPAAVALGVNATKENLEIKRKELRLDKPFPVRYANWAVDAVQGDFGNSFYTNKPVTDQMKRAFPVSVTLALFSIFLSLLIAIPLGVYAAYRVGGRVDRFINMVCFGSLAIPGFVLALFIILIALRLFSNTDANGNSTNFFLRDYVPFTQNPLKCIQSLFLPAFGVAIGSAASFIRIIRTDMVTTLQDDYVLMAKSKGMSDKYILARHAFRPSSFTLLTVVGIQVGQLLGNLVIVEQLYSLNGIGNLIFTSIFARDYPLTLAAVTIVTIVFVVVAALVDVLYGVIDPRVRFARKLA